MNIINLNLRFRCILFVLFFCAYNFSIIAYDFVEDGIYYNIVNETPEILSEVAVTFKVQNNATYSGDMVIPETVMHNGTEYTVTCIHWQAFRYCSNLNSVSIPNTILTICGNAFEGCTKLTEILIPESVKSIDTSALIGCSNIISIKVDENNKYYDSRKNCNAIIRTNTNELVIGCQNTNILPEIKSFGDCAFFGCTHLNKHIIIPNSVTRLGEDVFHNCKSIEKITIGNRVASIGTYTFTGCDSLKSIICTALEPPTMEATESGRLVCFSPSFNNATLYVPSLIFDKYNNNTDWNRFINMNEIEMELIVPGDVNHDSNVSISDVTKLIDILLE